MAKAWTNREPREAAEWLISVADEGKESVGAMREVATWWLDADPLEASAWVNELPFGVLRDAASEEFAQQLKYTDPEAVFEWAVAIGQSESRLKQATNTIREWRKKNEAVALQTLHVSDSLSASEKKAILQNLELEAR